MLVGRLEAIMQSTHIGIWGAVEVAKAERQVAVTNALLDLQRHLIEYLDQSGNESASAKDDFESLLVCLALQVNYRHRLCAMIRRRLNAA